MGWAAAPGFVFVAATLAGGSRPDADGSARLIAENPALVSQPDGLEVTLEPAAGSAAPTEPVVVAWIP